MAVTCMSHDPHSAVAARLDAPGTQYELDCIRPDFLLLRVRDPADPKMTIWECRCIYLW